MTRNRSTPDFLRSSRPALVIRHSSLVLAAVLGGCSAPTVNLATSEPIKVDINMRLDVYQYGQTGGAQKPAGQTSTSNPTPKTSRDNRMADIQIFKNNQLVGEGHEGMLVVRWDVVSKENEDYRKYIRQTVEAENDDRMTMMKAQADKDKISLPEVQSKQAEIWRNRAFKGEWIEVPIPENPGKWQWVQKEG